MVETYDLIIIGLGINGAGIARDAALRGLSVLAIDKSDIGSETSSWNSRLIHGGPHTLDQGDVSLARSLLTERERMLDVAPHLVRPRPMIMPLYRGACRSPLKVRLNMMAYDLLSLRKSLAHHRMLTPEETLTRVPGLEEQDLLGAALFWDCELFYPERLVLENVMSAQGAGAVIRTHTRMDRLLIEGNRVTGIEWTDTIDGSGGEARARVVINAAGPWIDQVLSALGETTPPRVSGLKESHIIVDTFPGAPEGHILFTESRLGGQPCFVIPWNDRLLIGTAVRVYQGEPGEATAGEDEVDELIEEVNRLIPTAGLTRASVLYTYSSVRPQIIEQSRGEARNLSRHFVILDHRPRVEGLMSVVGGRLGIYRELAEQAVDLTFHKLGRRPPRCRTHLLPMPGAEGDLIRFGWGFIMRSGLSEQAARRLVRIYGTRARHIEELWRSSSELKEQLDPSAPVLRAEVVMAFKHEMARTLSDALMRRTLAGLEPDLGRSVAVPAAAVMVQYLDWTEARAKAEITRHEREIERFRVPALHTRKH